ncbi:filamentous hemagglutinin N-terminal domain-containing protein [Acidithiobacillus ferrivorans]|nr:filamentous hemagglutinin N-terminal domain-containing protein [Acidithiobacillus ferrivorans]
MNKKHILKVSPLVGAVLLALSAPVAMATITAPATGTLPGSFSFNNSAPATPTYTTGSATAATITVSAGATVMQWGGTALTGGTVAAPAGITSNAGFDIGTGAALTVTNAATAATASVLISDQTGNPSQIYGTLTAAGAAGDAPSLFVANANGVIVGASATINLPAGGGFIGEKVSETSFAGGTIASSMTDTGAVSIASGTVNAAGYLLVAGNGNVNVGSVANTGTTTESVVSGFSFTASPLGAISTIGTQSTYVSDSSAVANLSGAYTTATAIPTVYAAGNVNLTGTAMDVTLAAVNGNLVNSGSATISATGITIGGSFTNNGTATLGAGLTVSGAATNNGTLEQSTHGLTAASITNNGKDTGYNLLATAGTITNNGTIDATGSAAVVLSATATSGAGIINTGTIENIGHASTLYMSASSGNISNTGTLNFAASGGSLSAVASAGNVTLDGTVNTGTIAAPVALSATNVLGGVTLTASGGALNLGTMLYNSGAAALSGNSVQVSAGGLIGAAAVDVTAASGNVTLWGGTTLAGATTDVNAGSTGNLVLAGQLGNSGSSTIIVTAGNIMAGANTMGGFNLSSSGTLTLDVYGNVVNQHGATAAAINYAKYVPVNANGGTATIQLDAANAGTAVQYINLGVSGSAAIVNGTWSGSTFTTVGSAASPVSTTTANGNNVTSYPFGALTLQATGSIALGTGSAGFYFPGQLRFANVKTLSNSSFTLNSASTANITLSGELANDVTSQILGNGGISFLTDNTLGGFGTATSPIITNTNAWINFASGTGLATTYNTLNPGYSAPDAAYGLTYKNSVFTTTLVGGTNTANVFNSVTMP